MHLSGKHNIIEAESGFVPSQWEKSLRSNAVSHWLGANLGSAVHHANWNFKVISLVRHKDEAPSHYRNPWWLVYWRSHASLGLNELKMGIYIWIQFVKTCGYKDSRLSNNRRSQIVCIWNFCFRIGPTYGRQVNTYHSHHEYNVKYNKSFHIDHSNLWYLFARHSASYGEWTSSLLREADSLHLLSISQYVPPYSWW